MSVSDWWPEPGSAEDWDWAERTLATIGRVYGNARRNLGYRYGSVEDDDLHDWLITFAMEFREKFTPHTPVPEHVCDEWCRVLYRVALERSFWHFSYLHQRTGLTGAELVYTITSQRSVDEPLTGQDGSMLVGDAGLALWPSQHPVDPADRVVQLDVLRRLVYRKTRCPAHGLTWMECLFVLDAIAPDPGAGQCAVWGCINPPDGGRTTEGGLCRKHRYDALRESGEPCSVDGCDGTVQHRGLCPKHYRRARAAEADPCTVDGCDKPQAARGYCANHYRRARMDGTLDLVQAPPGSHEAQAWRTCSVDGCDRRCMGKDLCRYHYDQQRLEDAPPCTVDGCDKPQVTSGLCHMHYQRAWQRERRKTAPPCSVPGCDKRVQAKGLCPSHYQAQRKAAIA